MPAPTGLIAFSPTIPAAPTGRLNVVPQTDSGAPIQRFSFHLPNLGQVDARTTTSETIGLASQGKLVTLSNSSSIAVSLDSSVPNYFLCGIQCIGAGGAVLTPTSGTINGASSVSVASTASCLLFFNGTNWWAMLGGTGSTGGGNSIGTISGLPGSGTIAGQTYYCTDAPYTFVWTGTIWQAFYAGMPVTPPVLSAMTQIAFLVGTLATQNNGPVLLFQEGTAAADHLSSLVVTPPATPYSYTLGFKIQAFSLSSFLRAGLILRNSSSGQCLTVSYLATDQVSGALTIPQGLFTVDTWTQPNSTTSATYNAAVASQYWIPADGAFFFKVENDGTNIKVHFPGGDPLSFFTASGNPDLFVSQPLSTWVSSIDEVGFFATAFSAVMPTKTSLFHFAQT